MFSRGRKQQLAGRYRLPLNIQFHAGSLLAVRFYRIYIRVFSKICGQSVCMHILVILEYIESKKTLPEGKMNETVQSMPVLCCRGGVRAWHFIVYDLFLPVGARLRCVSACGPGLVDLQALLNISCRRDDLMKVVVWKSPRFLSGFLRMIFKVSKD
jgi:hypothetical protein